MKQLQSACAVLVLGVALGGCSAGASTFNIPFGRDAGPARVSSVGVSVPAQQQLPVVSTPGGDKPNMTINASPQRVQDAIIRRAQSRGTTVVGANRTGVTLEVPLRASSSVVVEQCGEHREGRSLRVYLETLPNGQGTTVTEDRFVIDGGTQSCQLRLTQVDIQEANKSLADLKQQSEMSRTASAPRSPGRVDPVGGLAPLNPGRPVVPLR
jgi:hypothetical protein